MKHHIALKFLAFLLAAITLFGAVVSAAGIVVLSVAGLYETTVEDLYTERTQDIREAFARDLIEDYAVSAYGGFPYEGMVHHHYYQYYNDIYRYNSYYYTLTDNTGVIRESTLSDAPEESLGLLTHYRIPVENCSYPRFYRWESEVPEGLENPPVDPALEGNTLTDSQYINVGPHSSGHYQFLYYHDWTGPMTVDLYLMPGAFVDEPYWDALRAVYLYRMELPIVLGACLLAFAVFLVYLCCAAGKKPGSKEIRPGGLNRLPLDLYTAICVGGICLLVAACYLTLEELFTQVMVLSIVLLVGAGLACCLLFVALCFACAAQFKTPGGFWWRHSVIGWCLLLVRRFFRWIGRGFTLVRKGIRSLFAMLPVTWQWLATAAAMVLAVGISLLLAIASYGIIQFFFFLCCFASIAGCVLMVLYGGYCFGLLMTGAQKMAAGDLNHKVPTRYLFGAFRDFAERLNALGDAAQIAAARQMKSERMRTELITNVSHDIKTPLTSIINYVDLLQKPHTPPEGEAYLEVLQRQSQRLKKLIEDLMDMSKASTGNLTVEITTVDAVEAVNQSLGEFADKLALAQLTPIFRAPEKAVRMKADGRLVWRVMSNLLGNAVKYALPGTRLYLDLEERDGNVILSLKNISRESLNVSADELLERFVRGDASRNTDGSGLGLNIAQSLMELQHGRLDLLVDGDLFKVTLTFPGA